VACVCVCDDSNICLCRCFARFLQQQVACTADCSELSPALLSAYTSLSKAYDQVSVATQGPTLQKVCEDFFRRCGGHVEAPSLQPSTPTSLLLCRCNVMLPACVAVTHVPLSSVAFGTSSYWQRQ